MGRTAKVLLAGLCAVVLFSGATMAQVGAKKKRPLPHEYGRVVISNHSETNGLAAVAFDHWFHRTKFTCRLCHVDIGFALKAGGTGMRSADIMNGYYCGACHNGKRTIGSKPVFEACSKRVSPEDSKRCERCHSAGRNMVREHDFADVTKGFPRERFGNGIDWEKAEAEGLLKLIDALEGVSISRPALVIQKDFALAPKVEGMPDIIFSHKKHTVWSGCELCHPEIFKAVKKGEVKYSMVSIFEGRYCGACHGTVAFPLLDCQRCHTKQV